MWGVRTASGPRWVCARSWQLMLSWSTLLRLQVALQGICPKQALCFVHFPGLIDCAKAFDCVEHNILWKILKEMGIPDHLTYLLRNLFASQETTVRTGHGTTDWSQIGKEVRQGCILSP